MIKLIPLDYSCLFIIGNDYQYEYRQESDTITNNSGNVTLTNESGIKEINQLPLAEFSDADGNSFSTFTDLLSYTNRKKGDDDKIIVSSNLSGSSKIIPIAGCKVGNNAAITSESDSGFTCTKNGKGDYSVTFPTPLESRLKGTSFYFIDVIAIGDRVISNKIYETTGRVRVKVFNQPSNGLTGSVKDSSFQVIIYAKN